MLLEGEGEKFRLGFSNTFDVQVGSCVPRNPRAGPSPIADARAALLSDGTGTAHTTPSPLSSVPIHTYIGEYPEKGWSGGSCKGRRIHGASECSMRRRERTATAATGFNQGPDHRCRRRWWADRMPHR
ncbi:hypothetical protein MAPG_10387 [Magnaporthiopsis poae ATCC 64411]|uniref:Uncharacterized protein n=1 Tax=Magnaporthiopsis poae (strain ATCC 64411 / 73-15) TaxID=644358 RepID=A0A0C4ECG3_MAGP6|nr:hypothetical protein MAPG_10387 [Magnaporthiopsis poae ATCC 64411]